MEKKKINVSLSTVVLSVILVIAIIAIIIMGTMINKTSNEKLQAEQQVSILKEDLAQLEEKSSNLQEKIDTISSTINNTENENLKTELTSEELTGIANFLNNEENNGFLFTTYNNVKEIEWSPIFLQEKYLCKDNSIDSEYIEVTGIEEITGGIYKVTTSQIREVIKEKTGEDVTDINSINLNRFIYSSKYDSYYGICTDYIFTLVSCIDGYKEGNLYVINYKGIDDVGSAFFEKGTVKLVKVNNTYQFVSNEVNSYWN